MNIGMIVAVQEEIDTLLRACGEPRGTAEAPGYTVYRYDVGGNRIFVAGSGAGEIAAAATAQYLISACGAELLVNFGVCGGLTAEMGLMRTVVVEKAVHYDFDASPFYRILPCQYPDYPEIYLPATPALVAAACRTVPSLKPVVCASGDKFIEDPAVKARLHRDYGAEICEMEAAGILLTARRNGVPALLLKGVSDSVTGDAGEYAAMVHASAEVCLRVLLEILRGV